MRPTLSVDLAGISLRTPVLVASGCLRSPRELSGLVDLRKLGGIVTASVTLEPTSGSRGPRVTETPSGVLWSLGLQNPGVDAFLHDDLPALARIGVPIFVSVAGDGIEAFTRVAVGLRGAEGVVGLELNLSCPNMERGGEVFANRADHAAEVVAAVSRVAYVPVFAKLSAGVGDVADVAAACVRAGAAGLTLINSVPGVSLDPASGRPRLGAVYGGLSGPAIRPLAVRAVLQVSSALPGVPVMGVGGISTGEDAVEMMLAGARAVQVGTATLVDPSAPVEITKHILRYLKAEDLADPSHVRDEARLLRSAPPEGV